LTLVQCKNIFNSRDIEAYSQECRILIIIIYRQEVAIQCINERIMDHSSNHRNDVGISVAYGIGHAGNLKSNKKKFIFQEMVRLA
jgi:hypothetical protein